MRSTHRWPDEEPDGDEPVPLIELSGDVQAEGSVDQLTADAHVPGRARRAAPRRYLILGAAGLLAVGFVAGMVVQRASAPSSPTVAASAVSDQRSALPTEDDGGCHYVYGYHQAGLTTVCTGTLHAIAHSEDGWLLTLTDQDGAPTVVEARDNATVLPDRTIADLEIGAMVMVTAYGGADGVLHATAITLL